MDHEQRRRFRHGVVDVAVDGIGDADLAGQAQVLVGEWMQQ